MLLLGGASQAGASTIGVPNVGTIQISGAGVMGPGPAPPYDTRVSGNLDGSTAHYASEAGFLTEVSIAHWNTDPVTVKILVLSRGSADFLNVVQAPMTMVLPAAPSGYISSTVGRNSTSAPSPARSCESSSGVRG